MPNMDKTGPKGQGPKKQNKGMPMKDGSGKGRGKRNQGKGQCLRKRDGSCKK